MEDFNSTLANLDDVGPTSPNSSIIYWIAGSTVGFAVSVLLAVSIQMRRDRNNEVAQLQQMEEIEKRKSCPKRRKRAILKLIETKTMTPLLNQGEASQASSNMAPNDFNNSQSSEQEGDIKECPICLDIFQDGQEVSHSRAGKCDHVFHAECLEPWLMKQDGCPCCRVIFIDESTLLEEEEEEEEEKEEMGVEVMSEKIVTSPFQDGEENV